MVGLAGPRSWQPPASGPQRRERARKSTLACLWCLCSYQGTGLLLPAYTGRLAGAVSEAGWGRVAVVVVGVTSHQGARESLVQGEGPQVKAGQVVGVQRN